MHSFIYCAVATQVAVGDVDMALGTDTGGSVRVPACWCGIVGLKPTHGLVPFTGIMNLNPSLDTVGPMARTVYDCALLLQVLRLALDLSPKFQMNITNLRTYFYNLFCD